MPNRLTGSARLHVVAVFFNHYRSKNLLANFQRFTQHMKDLGVTLYTVEAVLNDSDFEVTDAANPYHIQKRVKYELFRKENLQNIGVHRAIELHGDDVKYLAMVDADLTFINANIVEDTISQLQRHKVVQMWSTALDLDPKGEPLVFAPKNVSTIKSLAYCYETVGLDNPVQNGYSVERHPGYAWAYRRSVWDEVGGFLDISILGTADHQMAWACVGNVEVGIHGGTSENYKQRVIEHLTRFKDAVKGDIGAVAGMILHHWHGTKESRRYIERWSIMVDNNYEPDTDLVRRHDGLIELNENKPQLRNDIRRYFAIRNDDCNVTADFFKLTL
jgi:hypothetical protein